MLDIGSSIAADTTAGLLALIRDPKATELALAKLSERMEAVQAQIKKLEELQREAKSQLGQVNVARGELEAKNQALLLQTQESAKLLADLRTQLDADHAQYKSDLSALRNAQAKLGADQQTLGDAQQQVRRDAQAVRQAQVQLVEAQGILESERQGFEAEKVTQLSWYKEHKDVLARAKTLLG